MALHKSYPIGFSAKGLADAFDSTLKFNGACNQLSNLIFMPGNPELLVCRPGVTSMSAFAGFTTPGVISCHICVDHLVYGMIASGLNTGHDQPFCWDNNAQAFISISGITSGNTPVTQPTTGAWTPPTMTQIGPYIIITHPGFPGSTIKFGWINVSNPAAPAWSAGTTALNDLPSTPIAVANFNNRAWFACGQYAYYCDVMITPLQMTLATQAVTLGDASIITALEGLPVSTQSSGVLSALIAFKGSQIWQITGDPLTSNLAVNFISLNTGTQSPRSIQQTQNGIYFCSTLGPYFLSAYAGLVTVSHSPGAQDTGDNQPDILAPFYGCTNVSRMASGYIAGLYRVCLDTIVNGQPSVRQDYWFDEVRRRWSGPHTFTYDSCDIIGSFFVLASNANPANLIESNFINSSSSVYTDLGVAYNVTLHSAQLPKNAEANMNMNEVVESTVELSQSGLSMIYTIQAQDENNTILSQVNITSPSSGLWNSGTWGDGQLWASSEVFPAIYTIPWSTPLIFKKLRLLVTAAANGSMCIGAIFARYQRTGYMNSR